MNSLTGKVAIVTGASKGIGASIAKAFCAEGASVVVNYASSKEGADRVLAEIADAGGNAIAVQGSVSDPEDVERLFSKTKTAFGKLDTLANNAGVFKFEPFENISVAEFNREFSTNMLGSILTIQETIKQFGFEGGRVINISSLAGSHSLPNGILYSATWKISPKGCRRSLELAGFESMPSRRAIPAAKVHRRRAFSARKASSTTSP
jgi:3-oxoacyl-[acyl-carrier protein] reductase